MPPPKKVGFLYSGSEQSLRSQFNAFKSVLPRGINLIRRVVDNDHRNLVQGFQGLIQSGVDVLVAAGGPVAAIAAQQATAAQTPPRPPVVFTSVTDPVGSGLYVANGNLTGVAGMTTEMDAARLRLLQELVPGLNQVGVLRNLNRPNLDAQWADLMRGKDPRLNLIPGDVDITANPPITIPQAIQNLRNQNVQALLVTADPLFNDQRAAVIAAVGNIPAIYQWREFVDERGLMSFGPNLVEEYTAAAKYVVRILNNEQPANIPLYQPTTFELVINGGAAKALRLRIPPSLRERAHVIKPVKRPPRKTVKRPGRKTVKRPRRA
jgi:putative ABC transport system substrate-binding protein